MARGGKREGAGRPKVAPALVRVTVTLTPNDVAWLRRWGGGNVSEGVRSMVADVMARDELERRSRERWTLPDTDEPAIRRWIETGEVE